MEVRNGKQIPDGGNFRGLFPLTRVPGEVRPETVANAIHSTPASRILTGTPTPRLTALRQAVRQVVALSAAGGADAQASGASTPATAITDTPRPGQSGSGAYTVTGSHGTRTISSTSNYSNLHNFRTSNNVSSMNILYLFQALHQRILDCKMSALQRAFTDPNGIAGGHVVLLFVMTVGGTQEKLLICF